MEKFTKHNQDVQRIRALPVAGKVKKFSLNHKAVYFYLCSWVESTGDAFPSLRRIADDLGTPQRTIQNTLNDLERFNIIRKEHRPYKSTRYHVASIAEIVSMSKQENTNVGTITNLIGNTGECAVKSAIENPWKQENFSHHMTCPSTGKWVHKSEVIEFSETQW